MSAFFYLLFIGLFVMILFNSCFGREKGRTRTVLRSSNIETANKTLSPEQIADRKKRQGWRDIIRPQHAGKFFVGRVGEAPAKSHPQKQPDNNEQGKK